MSAHKLRTFSWRWMCLLVASFAMTTYAADTHYVSLSGTNNSPYTNWPDATTNIQWAVNAATAGDTVLVSNGTYYLTNEIYLNGKMLTIKSVNGRDVTILDGNGAVRCMNLTGVTSPIIVDGFTMSNGYPSAGNGGGIAVSYASLVMNCRVCWNKCSGTNSDAGGGASVIPCLYTNTFFNCIFDNNILTNGSGGGMYVNLNSALGTGALLISNCVFVSNNASASGGGIRIVNTEKGISTIRNSFFGFNTSGGTGGGAAGTYSGTGTQTYENCTFVSNSSAAWPGGGGVQGSDIRCINCIIYYNRDTYGIYSNVYPNVICTNSCFAPTNSCAAGSVNNIESDPQFVGKDTGNFRPSRGSPCVNAGINESWMTGAFDLDGRRRIDRFSGVVDMGCYEYLLQGMMFSVP